MAMSVGRDDLEPRRYHEKNTVNGRTRPRAICCRACRGGVSETRERAETGFGTHVEGGVDIFCETEMGSAGGAGADQGGEGAHAGSRC